MGRGLKSTSQYCFYTIKGGQLFLSGGEERGRGAKNLTRGKYTVPIIMQVIVCS